MQQICPQAVPPQPNQWTAGRPAAHRLFGIRAQKTPQEKPRPEQKYPRDQRKIIRRIEARAGQAKRKQKRHAVQLALQLKQLQLANAQISHRDASQEQKQYKGSYGAGQRWRAVQKAAQQRASEIVSAAQTEARTVRQTVTDYCDNMLKTTEETMAENAAQVKSVRANLRQPPRKTTL